MSRVTIGELREDELAAADHIVLNSVSTYIGEMDLSIRPGSDVELCWRLRWAIPTQLSNYLCVDTAKGSAVFSVFRQGQGRTPINAPATLEDLAAGRTIRLAAVVREQQLSLYVDGQLALDDLNHRVPVNGTKPGIELESTTVKGLVRIQGSGCTNSDR